MWNYDPSTGPQDYSEAQIRQIRRKSCEFNCHRVEMGERHRSAAIMSDGTPEPEYSRDRELCYHPTTWPGAHLPHVWVERGKQRLSTLDLVGRARAK